jgi:hypothetical protein
MRSLFDNKRLVLLFAILALGALTVLATSLNKVPFREGEHFIREEAVQLELSSDDLSQIQVEAPLWNQIFIWSLIALIVILIGLLLSPEMRKRFFLMMIRTAFTIWGVYFLLRNYGDRLFGLPQIGTQVAPEGSESGSPPPAFIPPEISPAFSYLISFGFALLWLAILWGLYRGWKQYQLLNTKKPLDEIAKIARSSLDDLATGRNSSDVIINCYFRMSDVVSKRQLQREIAMTPHEFALHLERAGLPGDAVSRLTRLFEAVRYGDRKSAPRDVTEAVSCLKIILHYCGEPV